MQISPGVRGNLYSAMNHNSLCRVTKKWFIRLFVGNELIISNNIMFLRSSIQNSTQGGKLKKKIRGTYFSFSVFKLYLTKTKMTFLNSILYLCFFSIPVMILLYSCNFYYDLNLAEFLPSCPLYRNNMVRYEKGYFLMPTPNKHTNKM